MGRGSKGREEFPGGARWAEVRVSKICWSCDEVLVSERAFKRRQSGHKPGVRRGEEVKEKVEETGE